MIATSDPLHALLVAHQRAQSDLMSAMQRRIEADAATIAHLKAKLAAERCQRCAAIDAARALAGVETVRL